MDLEEFLGNKNITYIWTILFLPRNQSSLWHSCPFQYGQFDIYFIICIFRNSPFFFEFKSSVGFNKSSTHSARVKGQDIYFFKKLIYWWCIFYILFLFLDFYISTYYILTIKLAQSIHKIHLPEILYPIIFYFWMFFEISFTMLLFILISTLLFFRIVIWKKCMIIACPYYKYL